MRRRGGPLAACGLVMLPLWSALAGQTLDIHGHVDRAIRLLLSPDRTDGSCTDGLVSLLDATSGAGSVSLQRHASPH